MCGCLPHIPHWDPAHKPRHVPHLGIKLATLWFIGWCSIHWATPARAILEFLVNNFIFEYLQVQWDDGTCTEGLEPQLVLSPASNHLPWMGFQLLGPPTSSFLTPPLSRDHCCPLFCFGQGSSVLPIMSRSKAGRWPFSTQAINATGWASCPPLVQ